MISRVLLLPIIVLSVTLSVTAEEDPEILVEVERNQVYEGESFVYQITVKNVKNPAKPELGELKDCLVDYLGESSRNQSGITIVNGRMTKYEEFGMAFQYRLTPLKQGYLSIPAPKATVDGKELRGRPVTVKVIGPGEQDVVRLEISSDRETVYPLLPFTVTLRIFIKALPEPYSDQSPLTVQRRSQPAISIPWVSDHPPGLVPARHWREWLGPMEKQGRFFSQSEGFTINRIASFFPTDPSLYLPPHRRIRRQDAKGVETSYWEYTMEREFIAKKTGEFRFGPATLKGVFGTAWDQSSGLTGENIYAVSEAVIVTVKDAPLEGRPPEYTGAIGTFQLSCDIAPVTARVGDPITLTLRLTGKGTLDLARAPDLESVPEIRDHFKIYEATEETKGNVRTFTYSLRPRDANLESFPSVPLAYYDVDRDRYVIIKTDPVPIRIQTAEQFSDEDIVTGNDTRDEGRRHSIEARKEGLFANITDPGSLRDDKSGTDLRVLALELGGMLAMYLLALFGRNLHRKMTGDPALMRRRSAPARARSRLGEGQDRIREGDILAGMDRIRLAVAGLVADAADLPEEGVTKRDVKERLESFGTNPEVIYKIVQVIEACDAAQYGAQGSDASRVASECEEVVESLLTDLKKSGRLR